MPALRIRDDIDPVELRRRARREGDGRVGARLIALANALEGMDRATAARLAGMDRQTLRDWVHRYNAEGVTGLFNRPLPGRSPELTEGQMASLKAIVLCGPNPAVDRVERWRIVDLCRVVAERWGVAYSETGMLRLLWSLDLSHRKTRPVPPANRPEGAGRLQKRGFAARLGEIVEAHPEAERFEIWSQDEARVGQTGRTGYIWWQRGDAPRGRRDFGHRSAWIIGAVCPARDTGVALVMTRLDTKAMNLFLAELAQAVAPGAHAVVLMDKAGWHIAGDLVIPANLTPVFLPPYSPELNPIERLWLYLKDNQLSHRVFVGTAEIIDACCDALNTLIAETGRVRSLCSHPWLEKVSP